MLKFPYLCLTLVLQNVIVLFIRKMEIKMANRQKHVLSLEVVKNEVTSQNILSEVL